MSVSIIEAIINLVHNPVLSIKEKYKSGNRINAAGDSLEEYVKDIFAGTINCSGEERKKKLDQVFSYQGNSKNPPDAILRGGDALEIKKLTGINSPIQLNSSSPKHILSVEDPMLCKRCGECEEWREKDMLYIVGSVQHDELCQLSMVYGSDYCASHAYANIKDHIIEGVKSSPNVDLSITKELGRVNKVDPLGITNLRVRGVWEIANPIKVFDYVYQRDDSKKFNFMCLINSNKWRVLPSPSRIMELSIEDKRLVVKDVKIYDPDDPEQSKDAKLITFST